VNEKTSNEPILRLCQHQLQKGLLMDERLWIEGSDAVEDEALQQEMPEDTVSGLNWDYWHTGSWRIDMDRPCEQSIEIEPVLIYEGSFSNIPFQVHFSEQLSDEELKKYLRAFVSLIDEGGLDAIRAYS
jgi:hypothetical protein